MLVSPPSDLAFGAFSDHGPWRIDPDRLAWRAGVDELRAAAQAEVPTLVRRRMLPPLRRFAEAATLLGMALAGWQLRERRTGGTESRAGLSRRLRRAFERLGPAYIKLGQIVSSGQGLFPPELVDEFKRCRDQVPAEPFPVVRRVVEEDLGKPLAQRLHVLRRDADRGSVDRAGACGAAARRRGGGRQGAAPQRRATGAPRHRGHGVDRAAAGRAASRWRRSATRRRWSSCSPRPSSRSWTSGSKRRTCSTWPGCFTRPARRSSSCRARIPTLVTRRVLVMERLRRVQVRGRRGHAPRRRRHRRAGARAADRVPRGRHDLRRLPRRLPRRQPAGDARRTRRALRLRHHRTHGRSRSASPSCA